MQSGNKALLDDPEVYQRPERAANANELCFVTCLNIQEFRACPRPFAEAQYVWQYVDGPINIDGA